MAFTSLITVLAALISGSFALAGPATAPVHQAHCFASPHVCGYPDASNTGVPTGVTLQPSGSIEVKEDGAVISGLEVTGTIEIDADNVTVEDTKVTLDGPGCGPQTTCGNYDLHVEEGATGTVIKDSEFLTAPGTTCEHSIRNTSGPDLLMVGIYLRGCDSNLYGGGTLKDSYGIGRIAISDDHVENIYFNETRFTAIHDTLLNPVPQTAVVFGNSGGGNDVANCTNHLTILESLLAGGGYSLYPCSHAAGPGSSSVDIEGNHFARCVSRETYVPNGGTHPCAQGPDSSGYYPNSGSFGIASEYFNTGLTWHGNVWDDNLAKVCIDGRTVKRSCARR
ncbi:MAG: hypothetical protein QOH18_391 [Solirubrobacterales bacterium]|jgi:hypothetical protein|nr:hypothetical protein [Solirubrobacterales bacterium]